MGRAKIRAVHLSQGDVPCFKVLHSAGHVRLQVFDRDSQQVPLIQARLEAQECQKLIKALRARKAGAIR